MYDVTPGPQNPLKADATPRKGVLLHDGIVIWGQVVNTKVGLMLKSFATGVLFAVSEFKSIDPEDPHSIPAEPAGPRPYDDLR